MLALTFGSFLMLAVACMAKPLKPMDAAKIEHPTANQAKSRNDVLRKNGFVIVSRPNEGQPTWRLGTKEYLETDALALCGVANEL
jgi:hypothetical protein